MYYMWINKNLVHQVGDQTKVITQYIGKGAVSGFACVFKCEHNGRNTYTIHVIYESLHGLQNYLTKEKNILLYT